ncbi:hypothetical protein AB1Y20_002483 [Prymnesium parvum]|uniref:Uncharacterized protein n=1 Tax=Prymnesium parvum TaxID=97485 RepID=A0AB34JB83_PRYPA
MVEALQPSLLAELLRLDTPAMIRRRLAEEGYIPLGKQLAICNAVLSRRSAASYSTTTTASLASASAQASLASSSAQASLASASAQASLASSSAQASLASSSAQTSLASSSAQTSLASSSAQPRRYRVVHKPCVFIRERPSVSARCLGYAWPGDTVLVVEATTDGWLKLDGDEGWLLCDGAPLGLGALLEPTEETPHSRAVAGGEWPIVVLVTDGLCNRLRVVASYALVARREGRPLTVVWPRTRECAHGLFTDAFAPIPNVEFVEDAPEGVRPRFAPCAHDFHPAIKGTRGEDDCYELLALLPELAAAVDATVRACGPQFVSVHIRRTDHWGSTVTDADFDRFISTYPEHNVYIATDNVETQKHLMQRFRPRARVHAPICDGAGSQLRQTSLMQAVIDLYCSAAADGPFKGCPTSSFSDTIFRLRRVQHRTHPSDSHTLSDALLQYQVTLYTPGGHKTHSTRGMPCNTYSECG